MKVSLLNQHPNAQQTTAFTTLLVGVFLNSPLISTQGLASITEKAIYTKYGRPFLTSLQTFSELTTLEQMHMMHKLQR